ncbi:MAG: S1 RNA-binding domain-containing protein [Candidatus Cloacimonadales bacterium]
MEKEKLVNSEELKEETVQTEAVETEEVKPTVADENVEVKEDEAEESVAAVSDESEEAEETEETEESVKSEESKESDENSDFEQMLEDSLVNIQKINVGDKVEGDIINITDSLIFVSLGGKRDAYAEKNDYTNKDGELALEVGGKIEGYVVKASEAETVISKSLVSVNKRVLEEAFEESIPVQGKVSSMIKGGFNIDINGVRAFCPLSQIDLGVVSETKKYIGSTYDFKVIDFQQNGRNIVVSRRKILEALRDEQKKVTLAKLEEGSTVTGTVSRLTNFGAFIDLGGIDGLLHISEFSWNRIESPNELLNIGDEVETKVLKIKGNKISLSLKALQENPFDLAIKEINEGDVVSCRVLRNLAFGSFVEIVPGVEGLIPISEMSRGRRINNPSEIVTEGEMVEAQILKIKPNARKISLSLKALQPDPWDSVCEAINDGDIIRGKIESIASFGVFINVADGVSGLLPNVKMKPVKLELSKENIGEDIEVRVAKVDRAAKRISLEPADLPEGAVKSVQPRSDWREYKKEKSQEVEADNPFADL